MRNTTQQSNGKKAMMNDKNKESKMDMNDGGMKMNDDEKNENEMGESEENEESKEMMNPEMKEKMQEMMKSKMQEMMDGKMKSKMQEMMRPMVKEMISPMVKSMLKSTVQDIMNNSQEPSYKNITSGSMAGKVAEAIRPMGKNNKKRKMDKAGLAQK